MIVSWTEGINKDEREIRAERQRLYRINPERYGYSYPEDARTFRTSLELHDVAGIIQDTLGNEHPRDGWEWDRFRPGEVKPTTDNPMGAYLMRVKASTCFRNLRSWVERNGEMERNDL